MLPPRGLTHHGDKTDVGKKKAKTQSNSKSLGPQQSVNSAVKAICDIMRRSNCAGAMQYVPELTWILFLRILDERETQEAEEAEALGIQFTPSLESPYRWQDWAAPGSESREQMVSERILPQFACLGNFFSQPPVLEPPERGDCCRAYEQSEHTAKYPAK